ncbi:hypothetical protein [Saccharicrinis fermentans]|uniref:Uncharacterized protein n=1 Tax=Saccharicrinis fermentans DSM 9555 = JCM 21142 TaxID=869213 RepID=W7YAZ8_9BACT|nr:hypothetical protein [Saccharicrinis fermentans]GAF04808.1 hypothetical protein JCM21142_93526 [Saccharicrinis fermentans DSM 9555 = JCM 21142]
MYTDPSGYKWDWNWLNPVHWMSEGMQWINDNTSGLRQTMTDIGVPDFGVGINSNGNTFHYVGNGGNIYHNQLGNDYAGAVNSVINDARFAMDVAQSQGGSLGGSFVDGFVSGAAATWEGIKAPFTSWKGYGESVLNGLTLGMYGQVQMYNSLYQVGKGIPSYTANDYAFGAGFVAEKGLEIVLLRKASQVNPFGINNGYGFKIGRTEFMYANPNAGGGMIFSYKSLSGGKFRLDYHGFGSRGRTTHFHSNYWGYSNSPHRSINPFYFGQPIK